MGLTEMTEVQEKTIPEMWEGKGCHCQGAYGDWKDLRIWRADH